LWEKCFINDEEKQRFEDYNSTNYTPELCACHEEELQRLKEKFNRNK
jgi:hypothetical protein